MSYNTRRSGNLANQVPSPASAVGQRRLPAVSNNFVPGGQLNFNNQQGNYQQRQQQQPQQNFINQQQRTPPPNQKQFQQQVTQGQQQFQQHKIQGQQQIQQQQQQLLKKEPEQNYLQTESIGNNQTQSQPSNEEMIVDNSSSQSADNGEKKGKPFWLKNAGKISRKEKMRRRNKKLVKFLQPKNAVMVLNEMIGNTTYTLSENAEQMNNSSLFKASVLVDGIEHFGYGNSKMAAKSAAAETAIKSLILKKLKSTGQTTHSIVGTVESGEDVKMEENCNDPTLPWQHIASFALHKLFSTWEEGGKITERLVSATTTDGVSAVPEKKPAKKMPPNPESMNPIMLLNQMVPHAEYTELSKVGNPPNIVFTVKCSANGQSFIGRGSNKKQAKKMCAYEACRTLLNVVYPPEAFAPYSHSNN